MPNAPRSTFEILSQTIEQSGKSGCGQNSVIPYAGRYTGIIEMPQMCMKPGVTAPGNNFAEDTRKEKCVFQTPSANSLAFREWGNAHHARVNYLLLPDRRTNLPAQRGLLEVATNSINPLFDQKFLGKAKPLQEMEENRSYQRWYR